MGGFLGEGEARGCGQLSAGSGAQEKLAAPRVGGEVVVSEREFVASRGLHIQDGEIDRTVGGAHHLALSDAVANLKSGEAAGAGRASNARAGQGDLRHPFERLDSGIADRQEQRWTKSIE